MKCLFCPEQELLIDDCYNGSCPVCETKYDLDSYRGLRDKIVCYSFTVQYKDCNYYFDFISPRYTSELTFRLCTLKKTILTLNYFPDITPRNAASKLLTLLTFG
jgi:hypothetical protein